MPAGAKACCLAGVTIIEILLPIAAFIICVFALTALLRSGARKSTKVFWALIIIFLPVIGSLAYLLVAPSRAMDFDVLDKPPVNVRQQTDQNYEMSHRPLG
jgi:energy-coupling factor transporter transmembrane protein EcfT